MSEEDTLAGIGEFVISLVIGYFGALEFLFVIRQLVHWSGGHQTDGAQNAQDFERLQDNLNEQLIAARAREAAAGGLSVMQDGVIYANGFRIEPSQLNSNEDRKREIEAELERQKRIEEETRKQLAEAEAKLAEERRKAKEEAEAAAKEQQKLAEAEQKRREEEAEENTRKLLEAEKQREAEERQKEEAERKATERKAIEENERKLLDAEKQRAEAERLRELAEQERAESERKLFEAETQRAAEQRKQEEEAQARRDAEIVERLLEAERARKLSATESELEEEEERAAAQARRLIANEVDREQKQKLIDENARLFLEAEEEMVVLQQRLLEAAQADEYAGEVPVVEEPCVKKIVPPKFAETSSTDDNIEPIVQKVKTQFGQKSSEHPYSVSAKPLLFPSVSDEGSSWEPISSQQSSFSTQPSDDVTTGAEEALRQRLDTERQEPDGEDNVPDVQYTDEYLRSLDGIKSRSLIREDGSGRRRAFKKRRSSGSSNSSRDSRASREEEVKMFTSLEEEELRQGEKDDYNPIKYTSEPTLRVKSHHRRQKRSPAKDGKRSEDDSLRGSLEMLGEENTNPWGEIVPEHYKETEFWKREKAMSIDEEEIDLGRPASGEGLLKGDDAAATNLPKASSFEEATHAQNEEAATALKQKQQQQQRELSNEVVEKDTIEASKEPTSSSDSNSNLQTSNAEDATNPRASSSPRLRRSPRIEEINQYEERWREQEADAAKSSSSPPPTLNSPSISVHAPDSAPWRDSYGLIMEGLSDFYDFTASTNPSRSRSTSRNPSPVNTAPSTPQPRNVAHEMDVDNQTTIEVYDDTDELNTNEINKENIIEFIEAAINTAENAQAKVLCDSLQQVADKPGTEKEELQTMICESQEIVEHNLMIQTLREERRRTHSRSRSRSPLPTSDNLERSISTRRERLIKHNDEIFQKLGISSELKTDTERHSDDELSVGDSPESVADFVESLLNARKSRSKSKSPLRMPIDIRVETEEVITSERETEELEMSTHTELTTEQGIHKLVETLRAEQRQLSRSRSRSPLPTADNLERSITTRRNRLIQHNDEIFEKLNSNSSEEESSGSPILEPIEIKIDSVDVSNEMEIETSFESQDNMTQFVESLRAEQRSRSRSRSRSPLPTVDNLERSIASRRNRLIQHNDEIFEKLNSSSSDDDRKPHSGSGSPLIEPIEIKIDSVDVVNEMEIETSFESQDNMRQFVESLRAEQRSRSRSRSRSPLPTADNLERSIASRRSRLIQQNDELFEKLTTHDDSNSPVEIRIDSVEKNYEMETNQIEEDSTDSKQNMKQFVESLRAEQRSHSRSRSRSPLPTADNIDRSLQTRRLKRIKQNDELFEKLTEPTQEDPLNQKSSPENQSPLPTICVEYFDSETSMEVDVSTQVEEESRESMTKLVEQLRLNRSRSRSRSKTPLPSVVNKEQNEELLEQLQNLAQMSDSSTVTIGYVYEPEAEIGDELSDERDRRSLTPSRSRSVSPDRNSILANLSENYDFHVMLNLEASDNKTLTKNSEEYESVRAAKQREVDLEALQKLSTANEEVELRLLSPTELVRNIASLQDAESADSLNNLQEQERMRQLRCSPTTPDYDRTISEECRDVERIKQEILASGFKRSRYVGESIDLGSEFQDLRRETAHFRRSRSPSPSFDDTDLELAKAHANAQRELQAAILDSLTTQTVTTLNEQNENRLGAKPKTYDYDRTLSEEVLDTQRIKDEILSGNFKRSTFVGESLDLTAHLDDMRHRTAEFQRSRSQSRSPLAEEQVEALRNIDAEVVKRELEDEILDQFTASTVNFQNFSRHLNVDFLDSERRASDSALIQKPDLLLQLQEKNALNDLEPEEYHHFRRYSLAQEQPVEEYPSDDYVCISQIEVRTLTGTRTWVKEDFYGQDFEDSDLNLASGYSEESFSKADEASAIGSNWSNELAEGVSSESVSQELSDEVQYGDDYDDDDQEPYDSNDSEDERQTVVEIEDEFDEGISDYNERGGPTDESHHETSECEEAEREADRYANRDANDWEDIENVDEFLDYSIEEGAVGGVVTPYSDPDSFIEQIYNEAIKNRKQSGILRDYESIFQESQKTSAESAAESESEKATSDTDRSKVKTLVSASKNILESERRDNEMRYLGDANVSARQSTRLRSRYGYNPLLQSSAAEQNVDVDLDYKPKREYNWRKNFKLDDEQIANASGTERTELAEEEQVNDDVDESMKDYDDLNEEYLDMRRYSLGGESITLFSRSPEHEQLAQVPEEEAAGGELLAEEQAKTDNINEPGEANESKPKKKKTKSKKKTRKSSKTEEEAKDEDDSESQLYSRRSSSIQMETDSPKRKSRSRRSSKSSLTNEEPLFSPRSSLAFVDGIAEEESVDLAKATTTLKKKTKKRKKSIKEEADIKEEEHVNEILAAALAEIAPNSVSSNLTPVSEQQNALANVSAEQSVCVTPASIASAENVSEGITAPPSVGTMASSTSTTTTTNPRPVLDTFDILKDANFYPLF